MRRTNFSLLVYHILILFLFFLWLYFPCVLLRNFSRNGDRYAPETVSKAVSRGNNYDASADNDVSSDDDRLVLKRLNCKQHCFLSPWQQPNFYKIAFFVAHTGSASKEEGIMPMVWQSREEHHLLGRAGYTVVRRRFINSSVHLLVQVFGTRSARR